jgi:glycosyltransferase involved in cell wall biosynthesis
MHSPPEISPGIDAPLMGNPRFSAGPVRPPAPGRLLAVTAVDHPGGAETTLLRLLERLQSRGWEVTLTTPGDGPLREAALAAGHSWQALPVGGLGARTGARAVGSWPRAHRLARAASVVYLNGSVCGRLLPALPASGARRVLHIHDIVDRVPPFWRLANVVLSASQAVADRLGALGSLGSFGSLGSHVVYGPVDGDPPAAAAPWAPGGGPVIGFVGRIEPRKGPLDLVRAAPAIRRHLPGARVIVIGDDPYGTDPAYTRAVISSPEIEHHPWVANAPGVMRHLDVLVLPSHQEPFGTVLAEAMAVGTPVVATRVGGLAEVVDDGVTGRLVPAGDTDALAAAVLEVLHHRDRMSAAAREQSQRFHTGPYAEHVERLIAG